MSNDEDATLIPDSGARAYVMHSMLHMWPDQRCQTVLENIKSAMKPNYSKLLINEHVVPARDVF